jgi:hypothetical protein
VKEVKGVKVCFQVFRKKQEHPKGRGRGAAKKKKKNEKEGFSPFAPFALV